MKILITGAAGYIGSSLVEILLRETSHHVLAVDNLMFNQSPFGSEFRNRQFRFFRGDVRNQSLIQRLVTDADVIIPLAALVGAPICEKEPAMAEAVNHDAVLNMLGSLSGDQFVIMPTTNSGYGKGGANGFCDEDSPLNPISKYAVDKVELEKRLMQHSSAVSFRLATVFGMSRRMRLDLLVNDFVYRAVNDGYVVLYEAGFRRNYIHVEDVCYTFLRAIERPEIYSGQIFNVGLSEANLTKSELCEEIQVQIPGFRYFESQGQSDPDQRDYLVSNAKLEATGWRPRVSLQAGIQELIRGYEVVKKMGHSNV